MHGTTFIVLPLIDCNLCNQRTKLSFLILSAVIPVLQAEVKGRFSIITELLLTYQCSKTSLQIVLQF